MQVTGHVLRSRYVFIRKGGEESKQRVLDALSPTARRLMEEGPLETQWYPYEVYIEISEVIDRVLGEGDMRMYEVLGAHSCEQTLPGPFRMFFRFGNIGFLLKRASKAWHSQYDFGEMNIERDSENDRLVTVRVSEVPRPHIIHYLAIRGWMFKAAELTSTGVEAVWEQFDPAPGGEMIYRFRHW